MAAVKPSTEVTQDPNSIDKQRKSTDKSRTQIRHLLLLGVIATILALALASQPALLFARSTLRGSQLFGTRQLWFKGSDLRTITTIPPSVAGISDIHSMLSDSSESMGESTETVVKPIAVEKKLSAAEAARWNQCVVLLHGLYACLYRPMRSPALDGKLLLFE